MSPVRAWNVFWFRPVSARPLGAFRIVVGLLAFVNVALLWPDLDYWLTDRGVILVSTTDGVDSSKPAGRMMIGVLGSLAEYERELVKERTALKRQASRASGTKFGRPRKVANSEHIATAKRMKADGHTARPIAKYLGVSRATLYRYLATV